MPSEGEQAPQVEFTPEFKRNLRHLAKKYRRLEADVRPVIEQLQAGHTPGTQVQRTGHTVFKVRIRNSDGQRGKSSGYRMLYLLSSPDRVVLITIYSKSEQGDVSPDEIRRIISASSP